MTEIFEAETPYGKIVGLISIPRGSKKYPCVILSHGLVSSKESSKYVALSESLNNAGIAACRFDYHGCGESEGDIEETTLTIRIADLDAVVNYVINQSAVNPEQIGILGSSFGGSTCIVKAAKDRTIKCISLWATPYRLDKNEDEKISDIEFKESIYKDFLSYDLLSEAEKISHTLVIHGEHDEVVPCTEGKTIYMHINKPKKLEIIKNGDHVFSNLSHREKAIRLSLNWFRRHLLGG